MDFLLIGIVALLASGLTFFSGFGLGTLLLPAFALFFPLEASVAMTAVVHLLNNLFKWWLVGRNAEKAVVLRFGLPSVLAAFGGAFLLALLSGLEAFGEYALFGQTWYLHPLKWVMAVLMVFFALFEWVPHLSTLRFDSKWLPLGGIISGFFGGLSGHQGALRSAFLVRLGMTKEVFLGTGITIACLTDFTRIAVYSGQLNASALQQWPLMTCATVCAFLGAYLGNRWLHKATIGGIQKMVALLLILYAVLLLFGFI